MEKQAIPLGALIKRLATGTGVGPSAARGAAGALGGGLAGYYLTPKAFGYENQPAARNLSTFIDTILYGGLAAAGPRLGPVFRNPKSLLGALGMVGAGEILPVAQAGMVRGLDVAEGAKELQEKATKRLSQPGVLELLKYPAAKGAGGGAAAAALAALLTGMLRSRSLEETTAGRGRPAMVGMDFLKYLIPAMAAGGVVGSLVKQPSSTGPL